MDKKEYHKQYYLNHKEKMLNQFKDKRPEQTRRTIIKKLNDKLYNRLPESKIIKYDIKFDTEKNIYY